MSVILKEFGFVWGNRNIRGFFFFFGFFTWFCLFPFHHSFAADLALEDIFSGINRTEPESSELPQEKNKKVEARMKAEDIFSPINPMEPEPSELLSEKNETMEKINRTELSDREGFPLPKLTPVLNRFFERLNRNASWGGYLRNETAFRFVRPTGLTKIRNIFQLEGRNRFSRGLSLSGRAQCFYDAVYDVESIDVIHPRKGPDQILEDNVQGAAVDALDAANVRDVEIDRKGCDVKELFLDLNFQHIDLRIGEQIVRWGVVEGARVTDEINPLDFYELILRDIDDRYIPLFMVKTDLYLGSNTLEAIYIPEVRGHKPAGRGTQWEQFRFLPGLVKPKHAWERFPDNIENAEYALRWTHVFTGFEISGSFFYTWDDFPSSFRTIAGLGVFGVEPDISFKPEYNRLKIYGFSLSKTFPRAILNAEAAFVDGKIFGAQFDQTLSAPLGEIQRDFMKYSVGFDTYFFDTDISPAVIQQYIIDYDDRIIVERFDTVGAIFLQKEFIHNIWSTNLLVLYFFNDEDWLIRPRTFYNLSDRLQFSFGVDIFEGKIGTGLPGEFNFIGFFDNNDRIFWELTYSF